MNLSVFDNGTLGGVYTTPAALRVTAGGSPSPGNIFSAFIAVDSQNANVAAFGGTLEYDPAVLANPRGQLVGSETASIGMVLTENKNAIASGRYGFLADGGGNLPAGRHNVIMVIFDAISAGSPRLRFSGSVIPCSTSDWDADLVPTEYYDANGMKQDEIPLFPAGAGVNPAYGSGDGSGYLGPPIADYVPPAGTGKADGGRVTTQPPAVDGGPDAVPLEGGPTQQPAILQNIIGADGTIFGLSPLVALAIGAGALFLFSGGGRK